MGRCRPRNVESFRLVADLSQSWNRPVTGCAVPWVVWLVDVLFPPRCAGCGRSASLVIGAREADQPDRPVYDQAAPTRSSTTFAAPISPPAALGVPGPTARRRSPPPDRLGRRKRPQ